MTDWIEHNGGPQPVADDVWVEVADPIEGTYLSTAIGADWGHAPEYRILNQHLIDAARLEGIRLGLEAAEKEVWDGSNPRNIGNGWRALNGWQVVQKIRALNPDTIAREAVLDQLTSEAQEQDMGYDND